MRLVLKLGLLVIAGALVAPACGTQSAAPETICEPGENIFCRCRGGEAGTKTCKEDGMSFEPCVSRYGECPPIEPSGSTSSSSSGGGGGGGGGEGGSFGGGGRGGEGGGAPSALPIYAVCTSAESCESGICAMGYCSALCTSFQDCDAPKGDCIRVQEIPLCLRTCKTTSDCEDAFGARSQCGYVEAIDGFGQTVCALWEPAPALPPEGSSCVSSEECNLGNLNQARVCAFEACVEGCYEDRDCPADTSCPSEGALGLCR